MKSQTLGWMQLTLGDIANVDNGFAFKSADFLPKDSLEQGVPAIRMSDLKKGRLQTMNAARIGLATTSQAEKFALSTGDFLFGMSGSLGNFAVVRKNDLPCFLNQRVGRLRAKEGYSQKFINYLYLSDSCQKAIQEMATGAAQLNISIRNVRDLVIQVPPLPEQQKIAAILTTVEDKLDVIARQIEATQTLKQGLMQRLFSSGFGAEDADGRWVPHAEFQKSEFGEVPAQWRVCKLQEISEFITKGGTPTTYGFDWVNENDGIPFFRSECITDQGFNTKGMNFISIEAHRTMERSEVLPGDLLMTITGNIGRVSRAPIEYTTANINQHIARIRINNGDADYIYQYLQQEFYVKHYGSILTGQAYPQISLKQVRETPICLPPLCEQKKIARVLTDVDSKIELLRLKIAEFQNLKRGLMQKLLTGEWRVRVEASASET